MSGRIQAALLALCLVAAPAGAATLTEETAKEMAELAGQRDLVLARILRGNGDPTQAISDFLALDKRRRELLGAAAMAGPARQKAEAAMRASADYEAGWRCTLSADPAQPVQSDEGRLRADWGKVARVHKLRTAPKNELDEGELFTLYEVEGRAGRHFVRGERLGRSGHGRYTDFTADVGDLVMVCSGGEDINRRLPPPWDAVRFVRSGVAMRLVKPPKIVEKARWNPRHITNTRYFWAVHDVRWPYPPGQLVLSHLQINRDLGRDLGGGRFELIANRVPFVISVPDGLPRRELIAPGKWLWLILGEPRFDKTLRTLVLTVVDVEEHYIEER